MVPGDAPIANVPSSHRFDARKNKIWLEHVTAASQEFLARHAGAPSFVSCKPQVFGLPVVRHRPHHFESSLDAKKREKEKIRTGTEHSYILLAPHGHSLL